MADAPDTSGSSGGGKGKGSLGFLARKIGPVPVWLIAVALIAGFYWYQNYGPGKTSSTAATSAGDQIDPETGVSYASELGAANQQIADLQSQQPSGGGTIPSGTGTTSPPPGGGGNPQQPPPVTTGPTAITPITGNVRQTTPATGPQTFTPVTSGAMTTPPGTTPARPVPVPVRTVVAQPASKKAIARPARVTAAPAAPAVASRWRAA